MKNRDENNVITDKAVVFGHIKMPQGFGEILTVREAIQKNILDVKGGSGEAPQIIETTTATKISFFQKIALDP